MSVDDGTIRYSSPLAERYASRAMLELWSPRMRHGLLFDGRGMIAPADAVAAGLAYRGVGRRSVDPVMTPVESAAGR